MAMSGLGHRQCERLVAAVGSVVKASDILPLTLGVQIPPWLLLLLLVCCGAYS